MSVLRLALLALLAAPVACGGSSKAYVPVDSPLRPWTAPEPEEPADTEADTCGSDEPATADDAAKCEPPAGVPAPGAEAPAPEQP